MRTVGEIAGHLEVFAPLSLAEDWDNVGLLVGDAQAPVTKLMTCLTVTPETVNEALAEGVGMIVSHHPVLFKPVQRLTASSKDGALLVPLLRAGCAVYSPHTALDNCAGGINDFLAQRFGLHQVRPLKPFLEPAKVKLTVFVPDSDLPRVSDALFAAGAGVIGNYRECSFRVAGSGTFFGEEGAHPALGQKGRREEVNEWRLEVVCPVEKVAEALRALRQAHSYEEPAIDLVALHRSTDPRQGAGRLGQLTDTVTLRVFAKHVAAVLGVSSVDVVGDAERPVTKVAVVCGAGGSFLNDALQSRADVLVTGEMRFHDQVAAAAAGMGVVIAGHFATERPGVVDLAARLAAAFPDLQAWASRREVDAAWRLNG